MTDISQLSGIQTLSLAAMGNPAISKNFTLREFRCKDGSDKIIVDLDFIRNKLQVIRDHFNAPLTINSAYRNEAYNAKIGGARASFHCKGQAFDIVVRGHSPLEVAKFAQTIGINGIIQYNGFVHVDSRPIKYWARDNAGRISSRANGF